MNKKTSPVVIAGILIVVVVLALALGYGIRNGIHSRVEATGELTTQTQDNSVIAVTVVHPQAVAAAEEEVLPGNAQAFIASPIYARTSGYLKRWYADLGDHVKA